MKVLICDYVGISEQWLENFTVRKNFEVVGTILPATTQNQRALLAEDSWDYLLIFEQNSRQFFSLLIQFMNIPAERVIFALDELSWMTHPLAVYALINPEGGGAGDLPAGKFSDHTASRLLCHLHNVRRTSLRCHVE